MDGSSETEGQVNPKMAITFSFCIRFRFYGVQLPPTTTVPVSNRLVAIARLKQMWCIATKWCATCRRSQELNLDMGLSESMVYLKTRNVTVVIMFPIGIAIWWVYHIFKHTYVTPMWPMSTKLTCQLFFGGDFFPHPTFSISEYGKPAVPLLIPAMSCLHVCIYNID